MLTVPMKDSRKKSSRKLFWGEEERKQDHSIHVTKSSKRGDCHPLKQRIKEGGT